MKFQYNPDAYRDYPPEKRLEITNKLIVEYRKFIVKEKDYYYQQMAWKSLQMLYREKRLCEILIDIENE